MKAAKTTVRIVKATQKAYSKKWSFLVAFVLVFFATLDVCFATGFVPNPVQITPASFIASSTTTPEVTLQTSPLIVSALVPGVTAASAPSAPTNGSLNMNGELPTKVTIQSIGLSAPISNPATTNVDTLDQYLLSGAARYPTSATLGQNGNVVLFGHSSYLPIVNNKAYKTFDGIQNLKPGALITVYGNEGHVYTYAVQSVQKQNETTGYGIPLTTSVPTITLATCNSFATKSDRFIVIATLVPGGSTSGGGGPYSP